MGILNMLNIATTVACLGLAGCGKANLPTGPATTPSTTATTPNVVTPAADPVVASNDPTPTPTPVPTVSVTYYSKSETVTPNPGSYPSKSYTAIGYCAEYGGETYCWDNGVQSLTFTAGVTGYYTYWAQECNGTCSTDVASSPVQVDATFENHILTSVTVANVLSTGTPVTLSCTDDGSGNINCGSFTINTNQGPF